MDAVIGMFRHLQAGFMCDRSITGRKGWIRYMSSSDFQTQDYSVEME